MQKRKKKRFHALLRVDGRERVEAEERQQVKQTALQDKQKSVFNFARSDPSHVGAKHGRGLVGRGGWVLVPPGQSQSRVNLSAGE